MSVYSEESLALPVVVPSIPQPLDPYDLSSASLTSFGRWIRDILDPAVARLGGAAALSSDQVLKLRALLHNLQHGIMTTVPSVSASYQSTKSSLKPRPVLHIAPAPSTLPQLGTIAESRIHLALDIIRGKATRWPLSLADEADRVLHRWERAYHISLPSGLPPPL
jgi:hypothetical protein